MLRDTRYKLVKNHINGDDLFFDLETDPGEQINRIVDPACESRIREMEQVLESGFRQYADPARDGRYQFPKGMGQTELCRKEDGHGAYRPVAAMYHEI